MSDHGINKTDLMAYVAGGCSDMKLAAIGKHLLVCDECRTYCSGLESERQAFLKDNPFSETITLPFPAEKRAQPFIGKQYYALAASLVLFIASAFFFYRSGSETMAIRTKGAVGLKAFVQNRRGDIEKRQDGRYHPGEKIQFLYSCGAASRFILMGIDTAGAVTTYYPAKGDSSVALESGQDLPLPNSIVLDDYTGRELFIGVFSKQRLFVPTIKALLEGSFAATRSIDSVSLKTEGAVIVDYALTVLPGGEK